jgi:hypothetical protein
VDVDLPELVELLRDDEYREALSEQSYYRERRDEASADREHHTDPDTSYWVLSWESLSDDARRPYRTAVAEALDNVVRLAA